LHHGLVALAIELARPDDRRGRDVRAVEHPLHADVVIRPVAHEDQVLPRRLVLELMFDPRPLDAIAAVVDPPLAVDRERQDQQTGGCCQAHDRAADRSGARPPNAHLPRTRQRQREQDRRGVGGVVVLEPGDDRVGCNERSGREEGKPCRVPQYAPAPPRERADQADEPDRDQEIPQHVQLGEEVQLVSRPAQPSQRRELRLKIEAALELFVLPVELFVVIGPGRWRLLPEEQRHGHVLP
jgi:hypothetical protein